MVVQISNCRMYMTMTCSLRRRGVEARMSGTTDHLLAGEEDSSDVLHIKSKILEVVVVFHMSQ